MVNVKIGEEIYCNKCGEIIAKVGTEQSHIEIPHLSYDHEPCYWHFGPNYKATSIHSIIVCRKCGDKWWKKHEDCNFIDYCKWN